VLSAFALIIIGIGFFPNQILEKLIYPAAVRMGYEGYAMGHLGHFNFFEWEMLKPMVIVIVLAGVIYLPGSLRGWFNWVPPRWLSIHALVYQPLTRIFMAAVCRGGSLLDSSVNNLYERSGSTARSWCRYVGEFDASIDHLYQRSGEAARSLADRSSRMDRALDNAYANTGRVARRLVDRTGELDHALDEAYAKTGQSARRLVDRTGELDHALDEAYTKSGQAARRLVDRTGELDRSLDEAYTKAGESARKLAGKSVDWDDKPGPEETSRTKRWDPSQWNIKNLNFDTLLLAAVLGVVLFVIFYYGR
jgi:hydrogenase-4 component B